MKDASTILLMVGALGGCAGAVDAATPASPASPAAAPSVADDLARLRALQVFTVGEMVWQQPAEASNCYGPCPGSGPVIARAQAEGAARLDRFVSAAEAAARDTAHPHADACAPATIDANLAALRALRVVEVGAFLAAEPTNTGHCYGVCPDDAEAARVETCARAERLADVVDATRGL